MLQHLPLETIEQEVICLNPREQLYLIEKLVHQLKQHTPVSLSLDWKELYGLGKGLWDGRDAQDYVDEMREDRDASF